MKGQHFYPLNQITVGRVRGCVRLSKNPVEMVSSARVRNRSIFSIQKNRLFPADTGTWPVKWDVFETHVLSSCLLMGLWLLAGGLSASRVDACSMTTDVANRESTGFNILAFTGSCPSRGGLAT